MKKGVIFDMDGLMVDSSPIWKKAETKLLNEYNKEYSDEIRKQYLGKRVNGMIKVIKREYHLPQIYDGEKKLKAYVKENLSKPSVSLLSGCKQLVDSLYNSGNYVLAIASSSPREIIDLVVKRFKLGNEFQAIVSGEEVRNGKPAPDVFLKAAEMLNIEPVFCLVLEDAPLGIQAAKAGKMKAIAVSNSSHYNLQDFKEADRYVKTLKEINIDVIEQVFDN